MNTSSTSAPVLARSEYRDKVLACWLGKNIGGTLGAPYECQTRPLSLSFYDPVPAVAAANDDLDLQLVWLQMLEEVGVDPRLPHFAEYWRRYASPYPWNEYGFFMRNSARGLEPPVAGCFENYFVDEMGSPIRSEIWACLHPGDPDRAAELAWRDSAVDHAGGEGTYGEMFWAAVEAAAFVERDPLTLIRIGLNVIPISSHVARAIREVVWCHQNGLSWDEARERIVTRFGAFQPCNAVPNHGFTIIGWLYGRDFGDRLCKAVNCGYDTDCTGATLGSVLGIIEGTAGIPARWLEPVGRGITLHTFTSLLKDVAPKTVDELTDRTVALGEKAAALPGATVRLGERTILPADMRSRLLRNDRARAARAQDPQMGAVLLAGKQVELHYLGEPVLRPGEDKDLEITIEGHPAEGASLAAPAGVEVTQVSSHRFRLRAEKEVCARVSLDVTVPALGSARFTILGPSEARGFAAGANVAGCPGCNARLESCLCPPERKALLESVSWISAWKVLGPFAGRGPASVDLDTATSVDAELANGGRIDFGATHETLEGRRGWRGALVEGAAILDLGKALGLRSWCVGFAAATFEAAADGEADLLAGSDDGVRLYLNGEVVHSHEVQRAINDFDRVKVRVRKGTNQLVAKVDNYTLGWFLRVGVRLGPV